MKYTFKCPHCGGTLLLMIEDVLTTTVIESTSRSEYGMDIHEYGESEQLETTEHYGYECNKCQRQWPGLDEIDKEGGFVPVTDTQPTDYSE